MTLKKDDIVELVEKDDNGWWLVKKDGAEGWAPNNYLELVPPHSAPPPPPHAPPRKTPPAPKVIPSSVTPDASAKPVSVFPGMAPANGTAAPWKKSASTEGSQVSATTSAKAPPPLVNKPKPTPPIASKPGVTPKVGGKPSIPAAPRPTQVTSSRPAESAVKSAPGQLDLAAAVCGLVFSVQLFVDQARFSSLNAHSD
jgi:myosin-1